MLNWLELKEMIVRSKTTRFPRNSTIAAGLEGLHTMTGIPGWVGGAVYGNAGAYGHSIHEFVESVRLFDGSSVRDIDNAGCETVAWIRRDHPKLPPIACPSHREELQVLHPERFVETLLEKGGLVPQPTGVGFPADPP